MSALWLCRYCGSAFPTAEEWAAGDCCPATQAHRIVERIALAPPVIVPVPTDDELAAEIAREREAEWEAEREMLEWDRWMEGAL